MYFRNRPSLDLWGWCLKTFEDHRWWVKYAIKIYINKSRSCFSDSSRTFWKSGNRGQKFPIMDFYEKICFSFQINWINQLQGHIHVIFSLLNQIQAIGEVYFSQTYAEALEVPIPLHTGQWKMKDISTAKFQWSSFCVDFDVDG